MKKLGKNIVSKESVEAYLLVCRCSCYCIGGEAKYDGNISSFNDNYALEQ